MLLSAGISAHRLDIPIPLHAPDGFFSLPLAVAGYAIAALVIAFAIHRTGRDLNERMVPMMGVMAAFIFAAQMINFPVAGGTSGHLIGGALAAIILGPWAAIIVMTAVVGLQALLFQDGGLVVLGNKPVQHVYRQRSGGLRHLLPGAQDRLVVQARAVRGRIRGRVGLGDDGGGVHGVRAGDLGYVAVRRSRFPRLR